MKSKHLYTLKPLFDLYRIKGLSFIWDMLLNLNYLPNSKSLSFKQIILNSLQKYGPAHKVAKTNTTSYYSMEHAVTSASKS